MSTKAKSYNIAPEVLELARKIALKIYGNENYNLKAVVDYCIKHENDKLEGN